MKTGVMICGHGSRSQAAIDEFAVLARKLPALLPDDWLIDYGYLEFANPVIRDGLDRLRESGCDRILAVPGMLFAAMHAKNDIPTVLNTHVATAYLWEQVKALRHLENVPTGRLERAFVEHLDCASYRFDAWKAGLVIRPNRTRVGIALFLMRVSGIRVGAGISHKSNQSALVAASRALIQQNTLSPICR